MAFDKVWPEPYPPEGGYIRDGNDQIRDGWYAIRERLAKDHQFFQDEDGQSNIGYHKQVTLIEAADIGVGASGLPILGAQTIDDKPELVYTDEDDNDVQITSGGALNGDLVPAGIIAMWSGTIADIPTAWSLCDGTSSTPNLVEKMVRCVASGTDPGGTGGSDTLAGTSASHTLTTAQIAAHTHTIATRTGTGPPFVEPYGSPNTGGTVGTATTASTGGGGGHTHSLTSVANIPAYYALAFIMKD